MERNIFWQIDAINEITEDSCLKAERLHGAKIKKLAKFLDMTDMQTVLFCAICELCYGASASIENIANFFGCSRVKLLSYSSDFKELQRRHFIRKQAHNRRRGSETVFVLPPDVFRALAEDRPYAYQVPHFDKCEQWIESVMSNHKDCQMGEIDTDEMDQNCEELIAENQHLPIVMKFHKYTHGLSQTEKKLFLFTMVQAFDFNYEEAFGADDWKYLKANEDSVVWNCMERNLKSGLSPLITLGHIAHVFREGRASQDEYCLNQDVKKDLFEECLSSMVASCEQKLKNKLIDCEKKATKELFFNAKTQDEINLLDEMMGVNNLVSVQQSLLEGGLRCGITCAFYGVPGVGKTELVYQLCKKHHRKLFKVDLSAVQSKWVGESEEHTRQIFTDYRELCDCCRKSGELLPVLFINEADGFFCKRTTHIDHSVDQMHNTMQNIILEEMEELDGIMIITTNLMDNFDSACLRRFLYSVEFEKPTTETSANIYHSMFPMLDKVESLRLANEFPNLSGGNIENVKRKSVIEYAVRHTAIDYNLVRRFCAEERTPHTIAKIGY